ncbi:hypothetical protein RND81_07G123900 [Saponaria officinalis]|uniref:Uncharacterized protein n=1 Tax=Saponaria officinalis TaxID=3572 RepID=A0AAW1JRU5_SAPOF
MMKRNNIYNNNYIVLAKEDPKEKSHREAQFLIYKTMKKIDQIVRKKSSSSWLKLRICKLKVKIGKKLLLLKKTMLCNMSKTKGGVCKHIMGHFKGFKRLFNGVGGGGGRGGGGRTVVNHLPQPLFTI